MTKTATKPYPEMVPFTDEQVLDVSGRDMQVGSLGRLRLLWNKRRFLARAATVGLLAGVLLAFLLPKRYEATAQLMPPDSQGSTGMAMLAALMSRGSGGAGSLGGIAGDLLGMKSSGDLFVGILRSRTVEDRIVDRFQLQKVYGIRLKQDASRHLAQKTDISEDRKSGILTITVTDRDAVRSAAIAEAYVDELDRLVGQLSTSAAHRQRVFLEQRLAEVSRDLESAEKEFGQFASKNTAIDIKEQGKAMMGAAAELQGQIIATQSELEGLRQIYTENNVRVKAAEAKLAGLKNELQQLGGADKPGDFNAEENSTSLYPSIRKLPLLGVTYADLYRRTKVDEAVFEALTQQYEMAKVEEAKDTPSVKVLDSAQVPEKRSFPPRLLVVFVCTVLAVAAAALLTTVSALWQQTDARNPGKRLAQEVLETLNAHMPWATPNGSRLQGLRYQYWRRLARNRRREEETRQSGS